MRAGEGWADEQRAEGGQFGAATSGTGDAFDFDYGRGGYQRGRRDGIAERGTKWRAHWQGSGDYFGSAGGDPGDSGADCFEGEQLDYRVAAERAVPASIAGLRVNGDIAAGYVVSGWQPAANSL